MFGGQLVRECVESVTQVGQLLGCEPSGAGDLLLRVRGRHLELLATLAGHDHHLPTVEALAAAHESSGLQASYQGGDGVGVDPEASGEAPDGGGSVLPQREHHEVLGIGEADLFEQGTVSPRDGMRGGVQREAQLVVQAHPGAHAGTVHADLDLCDGAHTANTSRVTRLVKCFTTEHPLTGVAHVSRGGADGGPGSTSVR